MAVEEKKAVSMDTMPLDEAKDWAKSIAMASVEDIAQIYGGYSSVNFKVRGVLSGETQSRNFLFKVMYSGTTDEDALHQVHVLQHLHKVSFPTNYMHGELSIRGERKAMLVDFFDNIVPGQQVLRSDDSKVPKLLMDLAAALAQLHKIEWPATPVLRDIRVGFPVCNTGDFLRGQLLSDMMADSAFKEKHPFVDYAFSKLEWLRGLYDRDLPWGLIHGDAFLDNTLYEDGPRGSGECQLKALVDWEDSCRGPFVLDLAICCSACCFTATNELTQDRLQVLIKAYLKERQLSRSEMDAFPSFMQAGALACAFYRFYEFNWRKSDSSEEAKDSYKIMFARAELLEAGSAACRVITDTLSTVGAPDSASGSEAKDPSA